METNTFNAAVTTTGASSLSVTAPQSIVVSASLTGGTGGTTLLALGTAALDSIGVWVQNGAVVSATAGGAVSVTGTGGAGAGGSNIGVNIDASGQVTSGGAGQRHRHRRCRGRR
ncbi:MAG: hypothetical protein U0797_21485 [Gemmataceae bacterium]